MSERLTPERRGVMPLPLTDREIARFEVLQAKGPLDGFRQHMGVPRERAMEDVRAEITQECIEVANKQREAWGKV